MVLAVRSERCAVVALNEREDAACEERGDSEMSDK